MICLKFAIEYWILLSTSYLIWAQNREDPIPSVMRAVVLESTGPPDVLQVKQIPVPTISENQTLIKVKGVGINPIDGYLRNGSHFTKPTLPMILGKEISGIVLQIDEPYPRFQVGDRVFCGIESGGYAEYAVANASNCYPLTDKLTFHEGAAIYITYFGAYRGLVIRGHMKQDDLVLIHGASGSLGFAAIQVAKAFGASVVASVGDDDAKKIATEAGADLVVFHNNRTYLSDALRIRGKLGFNVIFEIIAKLNLQRDKEHLASYGRIVVVGNRVSLREVGPPIYSVSLFKFTEKEQRDAANFIVGHLDDGTIFPLVRKVYTLDQASIAHTELASLEATKGKLVFVL